MRPIFIILVGYVIGIIWGLYFSICIAPFFILFLILLYQIQKVYPTHPWIRYRKVFLSKNVLILLFIPCVISNTIVLFQNHQYQNLYQSVTSEEFVATVISDEVRKEYDSVYEIRVESICQNKKYKGTKLILKTKEKESLHYGDQIVFTGEYQKPQQARNKGGFDYSKYLKTIGIYGTVKTDKDTLQIKEKNHLPLILLVANRFKHSVMERAEAVLSKEKAKLLQGILLGETDGLEEETIEDFQNSNLYHLLAVSGSHVAYIILGCQFLFGKLGKRKANITTIFILAFFIFVTGFSLSVVRACTMGILVLGANLFYRKSDFMNNISLALLLILIQNPYAIYSLSVLLSFGGTIGIVFLSKQMMRGRQKEGMLLKENKFKQYIKVNLRVTLSAQVVIAPIILIHFHTISTTFFLSNGLASILIGPIILLGFLSVFLSFLSIPIARFMGIFLNFFLSLLEQTAKFTAQIPFSNLLVVSIPFIFIILYYFLLFLFYFYQTISQKESKRVTEKRFLKKLQSIHRKKILIYGLIWILLFQLVSISTRQFTLSFIDVGQGDACLVVTRQNKKILIDGGGSESTSFDVGEKILIPYLLNRGIKTLDYVIISHFDTDHCGGILTVLEKLRVKQVIIGKQEKDSENYQKFKEIIKQKRIPVKVVKAGDSIPIDSEVKFDILWPQEEQIQENALNNNSVVAKLVYGKVSILFTGDIEEIAERAILEKYERCSSILTTTILKVAHHGSKTSSIEEMIKAVKPKIALIGVGENNTFGHPNEEVLQKLKDISCQIYRTDESGEITIKVKGNRFKVERLL